MTRFDDPFRSGSDPKSPVSPRRHSDEAAQSDRMHIAARINRMNRPGRLDSEPQGRAETATPHQLPKKGTFLPLAVSVVVLLGLFGGGLYFASRHNWFNFSRVQSSSPAVPSVESATVLFSGRANELSAGLGNALQQDTSDPSVVWIESSLKAAKPSGATDGVSVKVPSPLSEQVQGKRVRVTVSAKSGKDAPSPFAVAYSTGAASNSGWIVFQPTRDFDDFSFVYRVPRSSGSGVTHYVGIWSDIAGQGVPLAIRRVAITPLP
jgi:hypothetical protein